MKYSLDTNIIISHFKGDKFSNDIDSFFAWVKDAGHEMYIAMPNFLPEFIYLTIQQKKRRGCNDS